MKNKLKKAGMLLKLARQERLMARCEHARKLAVENELAERFTDFEHARKDYDRAFAAQIDSGGSVIGGYADSYRVIEKQIRKTAGVLRDARKESDMTQTKFNESFIRQLAVEQYAAKIHEMIHKAEEKSESRMMDYVFVSRLKMQNGVFLCGL